jgi:hypothetical protein
VEQPSPDLGSLRPRASAAVRCCVLAQCARRARIAAGCMHIRALVRLYVYARCALRCIACACVGGGMGCNFRCNCIRINSQRVRGAVGVKVPSCTPGRIEICPAGYGATSAI